MRKDELQDYNDELLKELEPILAVSPTLRGRFFELLFFVIICFGAMYLLKQVNPDGYMLNKLLKLDWTILRKNLSYNFFAWPLRAIGLSALGRIIWITLQQKMTVYKITDMYLEKQSGVLNKESSSIDLVKIEDQKENQSFLDMILGIAKVVVYAPRDKTDPELNIKGISKSDASKLLIYLRNNSMTNITELRLAQEKKRNRENLKQKSKNRIDDDYGDGEGE